MSLQINKADSALSVQEVRKALSIMRKAWNNEHDDGRDESKDSDKKSDVEEKEYIKKNIVFRISGLLPNPINQTGHIRGDLSYAKFAIAFINKT